MRKAALFREKGYAPLHGLIHPFHVAALRRYYRHQIRTEAIPQGMDRAHSATLPTMIRWLASFISRSQCHSVLWWESRSSPLMFIWPRT